MFFNIIIPTYNSGKYLHRALNSILTNDCLNDIEVIIADDLSTENFDYILEEFSDKIAIKTIKNPIHYGGPYGGREFGAQVATAEWICFMDHDDEWLPHAFDNVKNYILTNNIHNYLVTNFITYNDETQQSEEVIFRLNWTHGKFYEKNFLVEQNIHYSSDVRFCEDINLSVQMVCILHNLNLEVAYYSEFTYVWHHHPDSLSQINGISDYFFKSFPDYIDVTLKVYLDKIKDNHNKDNEFYKVNTASMMYYLYFYYQGLKYKLNKCPKIPKLYYKKIWENFKKMKKEFGWTVKSFLELTKYDLDYKSEYNSAREMATGQVPFFETETFDHFMKMLYIRSII